MRNCIHSEKLIDDVTAYVIEASLSDGSRVYDVQLKIEDGGKRLLLDLACADEKSALKAVRAFREMFGHGADVPIIGASFEIEEVE